ncbi:MAG TPA: DUF4160 domain-containing protein [Rhizomicrobium sp.]|jgi:hypothetical protein|nr:DUF4160 domain-containing protein [Rhizomicrobium sp.]
MPTIFDPKSNWKITMYFGDHNPPHFHIVMSDGSEALIEIATQQALEGKVPAKVLKKAVAWAEENGELLDAKWREFHLLK